MKKLWLIAGFAGVLGAPSLQAGLVQLYQDTGNYSYGNGGEFQAVTTDGSLNWVLPFYDAKAKNALGGGGFQTFCIEGSEVFYPGTPYPWATSPNALNGSQGAGGDPISKGTAYLYSQFAKGTLSGYNYTYGGSRTTTAGQLQDMIWALEGEEGKTVSGESLNPFYADLVSALGASTGVWTADANGAYNVRALNLGAPGAVQDQLVVVPEPSTMIAGALLLLPFGMGAVRSMRKRS